MTRAIQGAALAVAFSVAVVAGRLALLALVAVLAALASGEVYRLSRSRGFHPVPVVGLIGMAGLLFAAHMRGDQAPRIFPGILAAVVGGTFLILMARRKHHEITRGLAFTMLPVLSVGLFSAHLLVVRGGRDGTAVALLFGAMVAASEVGAWALDKILSRRFAARTRPAWERFAGAIVGAQLAGLLVSLIRPETIEAGAVLALGALMGVATSTGELVGAMVEQDLLRIEPGVRRTPAGMLRRIDGALLGAPVFFYAFRLLAR